MVCETRIHVYDEEISVIETRINFCERAGRPRHIVATNFLVSSHDAEAATSSSEETPTCERAGWFARAIARSPRRKTRAINRTRLLEVFARGTGSQGPGF